MFGLLKNKTEEERRWEDFELEAMPFSPDLFRVAMFLKRNRDSAEDLVQETMMQALKSFHRFEKGTNCKAWMTTIMYHTHYKQLRKETNLKLVPDTEEKIAQTIQFEAPIPQQLTDEDVLAALEKVPEIFREIVMLCDVEGFAVDGNSDGNRDVSSAPRTKDIAERIGRLCKELRNKDG
jgi:RNA polymerase sigma-70 factor, ECF subfamily